MLATQKKKETDLEPNQAHQNQTYVKAGVLLHWPTDLHFEIGDFKHVWPTLHWKWMTIWSVV